MTVLSANRETTRKEGGLKSHPCEVDTLYKGAMVAITPAGYAIAMAATAGYTMGGVSYEKVVCAAQAAENVRLYTEGLFKFAATSISQAMVGQAMYAVDDQTFDDEPGAEAIFVGILAEYVSATEGWLDIGPAIGQRATKRVPIITKTDDYTVLEEESGAVFLTATDAKTFVLPATKKGLEYTFVNYGADAAVLLTIDPNGADLIAGNDLIGNDGGALTNTKATAKRNDMVKLVGDGGNGWIIVTCIGVWAVA